MASPSQALVLRFSTDLEPARRSLTTFAGQAGAQLAGLGVSAIVAAKNMGVLGDQAGGVGGALQKVAGYIVAYKAALLTATAVIAAVGLAASAAHVQLEKLHSIAAGSKSADVGTTFFQQWVRDAEKAGFAAKDAEQAIIRAREAVADKRDVLGNVAPNTVGALLEENVKNRGGVNSQALAAFQAAPDTESRIRAVVAAIRELDAEAQKTFTGDLNRVGDKLAEITFGSDKYAEAIRNASDATAAFALAGGASGNNVFSAEIVARAAEFDERLRDAHATMIDKLHPAIGDLTRVSLDVKGVWVDILEILAKVVGAVGQYYDALKRVGSLTPGRQAGSQIAAAFPANPGPANPLGLAVGGQVAAGLEARAAAAAAAGTAIPHPAPTARPGDLDRKTGGASGGAASDYDAVEGYLEQLRRSVDVLQAQADAYGKSNAEKAIAVDLARAESAARQRGTPLTEAETAAVRRLAEQEGALKQKILEQRKAMEDAHEQAKFFADTLYDAFEGVVTGSSSAEEAINGITKALMKAALQGVLLGQGPLAGLFGLGATPGATGADAQGGLFGALFKALPAFADGGAVPGVNGAVPIMAHAGEIVLNRAQQSALAASTGGGGTSIVVNNHAGADVSARETQGPGGRRQIEIMVDQALASAVRRNTRGAQVFQNQYGLSRSRGISA